MKDENPFFLLIYDDFCRSQSWEEWCQLRVFQCNYSSTTLDPENDQSSLHMYSLNVVLALGIKVAASMAYPKGPAKMIETAPKTKWGHKKWKIEKRLLVALATLTVHLPIASSK